MSFKTDLPPPEFAGTPPNKKRRSGGSGEDGEDDDVVADNEYRSNTPPLSMRYAAGHSDNETANDVRGDGCSPLNRSCFH